MLELDFAGEILFKDHFFLQVAVGTDTGSLCLFKHGVGNGHIHIGKTHGIKVDKLVIAFAAGLFTGENIDQVAIDIGIGDDTVLIAAADGLGAVLNGLLIIANDFICHLHHSIFIFPTADVAVECTLLDPGSLQQGSLCAGSGDDDITAFYGILQNGMAGDDGHVGNQRSHLLNEALLFVIVLGGDLTDLQTRTDGLHAQQVHLCLLTGTDEADGFGIFPGKRFRCGSAHGGHAQHPRPPCSIHAVRLRNQSGTLALTHRSGDSHPPDALLRKSGIFTSTRQTIPAFIYILILQITLFVSVKVVEIYCISLLLIHAIVLSISKVTSYRHGLL